MFRLQPPRNPQRPTPDQTHRATELTDVQNHPLPVVRRRGRGGHEILCFAAARFQNRKGPEEPRKIDCADQAEVDLLWDALSANGGQVERCGWLKDRYGVSWQIVPTALAQYLGGADRAGAQRAMQAMLGMVKLDIAGLKRAYEGKSAA